MDDRDILNELAPEAERLLERHLGVSKEWFPHQLVPWDRAAKADPREPWEAENHPMDEAVRQALFLNLLTEDNLPYYTSKIDRMFGLDHPWNTWNRRWTAEEGRHSIVIRDYLTLSGAVDPVALERGRMQQMSHGFHQPIANACEGFVYVALQELATTHLPPQHRQGAGRPGRVRGHGQGGGRREPPLPLLPRRLHRGGGGRPDRRWCWPWSARSATSRCPAPASRASTRWPRPSPRPASTTSPSTTTRSSCRSSLRHWGLESLEGLSPEAEPARDSLLARIAKIGRVGPPPGRASRRRRSLTLAVQPRLRRFAAPAPPFRSTGSAVWQHRLVVGRPGGGVIRESGR